MDNKDNKYDIVLDIIENPDKYTSSQLEEILSDPETREIYTLLCKTDSAIEAGKTVDVDAEWDKFSRKHAIRPRSAFRWKSGRAASIAIIVCTSIAAIAAGIVITEAVKDKNTTPVAENVSDATTLADAIPQESTIERRDSIMELPSPVMFEDDSLETIMNAIAATYRVNVIFRNKEAATLHLYYRLDPSLPLDDVISQLNTFEQINIIRNGDALTID